MTKFLILVLILICCCILWALPLWIVVNFVSWVFGLSVHISLLQAFALCLLITLLHNMLFKDKEDK